MRKWPAISVLELYTKADTQSWNRFLTGCLLNNDLERLKQTLYGVQAGMDDAVKQGLNSDKLNLFFIRIQRSIEMTAKKIIRSKHPNPLDNPGNAKEYFTKHIEAKRRRDHELELFLRASSY